MTVPTSDNREEYTGNDSTTVFPYAFKIFEDSDLEVYLQDSDGNETPLVLNTDYSVSGAGNVNGGNVTYPLSGDPLASDESLIILRVIPIVQDTDLRNQGAYYPQTLEDELDRSRMIDQQQQEEIDRSLKYPAAEDGYDAGSRQIKNVADGTDPGDVLNKGQIDNKFANEVITQTGGNWDGKGKRALSFQTSNTPASDELVNAQYLEAYVASVIAGGEGVIPETYFFDGDGSTTVFSTPGITALDPSSYTVTIDGIDQRPGTDYTVDVGTETVTFTEAPPAPFSGETDNVMIRVLAYKQAISEAQTAQVDTGTGIQTVPEALDSRVVRVSSRTEMKGYDVPAGYQFSLEEGGRSGLFVFRSGDQSSNVTNDPLEGVWVAPNSDLTGASGAFMRSYSSLTADGGIKAAWWGADDAADPTANLQAMLDYAVLTPGSPLRCKLTEGLNYVITDDLVVNARETAYSTNWAKLEIVAEGQAGVFGGQIGGTTISCTTAGVNMLRICEEQPADVNTSGAYPGGGADVVTDPLNYIRRVTIKGISFIGDSADPDAVNAIVGRGIYLSDFEECGFHNVNFAIRCGKAFATSQEQSADGFDLDYCERNTFTKCLFNNVKYHIHILQGDTTRMVQNTHNPLQTVDGLFYYFAGGNDAYVTEGSIFQARSAGNLDLDEGIRVVGGRQYTFKDCHVEGQKGRFFNALTQRFDVLLFEGGLFEADGDITDRIFSLFMNPDGIVNFKYVDAIAPSYSTGTWFYLIDNRDTVKIRKRPNYVKTSLVGTTQSTIRDNIDSLGYGELSWTDPLVGNNFYLWERGNQLWYNTTEPTSDVDGTRIDNANVKSTFAVPATTIPAGASTTITAVSMTGAAFGNFIQVSPTEETSGLQITVHPTTVGSEVDITLTNTTGASISIGGVNWGYRIVNA